MERLGGARTKQLTRNLVRLPSNCVTKPPALIIEGEELGSTGRQAGNSDGKRFSGWLDIVKVDMRCETAWQAFNCTA